jgi:tetratricopeptide (TPR) repeat protein
VLHVLARAADARGDDAVALRFADEAIEQRRSTGQRAHEAESLVLRGASLARLGRHEDARAAWTEALAAARETSSPPVLVLASAGLAAAPGGDAGPALAALAADESALEWLPAMEARFVLWRATGDAAHLAEARRRLAFLVENAPEDCRGSMVGGVRLHREIAEASESPG